MNVTTLTSVNKSREVDKLVVGLFLPEQREVVAEHVRKGDMDLLVYPEDHDDLENLEKWKEHANKIDAPIIIGFKDSKGAQLGYFYNPNNGDSIIYIKHSTAKSIAFQDRNWSPENNLKLVDLKGFKIGITICHDMYLSLLMRYLTKSGAEILINPSDTRVQRKKWATILRARAIENRAYTLCTLHDKDGHPVKKSVNKGHVFG